MTVQILNLAVGERLWLDGQVWRITECDADSVVLAAGTTIRRIAPAALVGNALPLSETTGDETEELDAIVLASLTSDQRKKVLAQANVLAKVVDFGRSRADVARAADELGVSERTAYRMLARFEQRGPGGLVDARLLHPKRRSVDPDWDVTCLEVLQAYKDRSNPTVRLVIAKTNTAFRRAHPDRKLPSDSVAYLRVRELDKGRYTFGAAKQRRSVAERPQGVLGRLVADRPGQYLVLDTTRLDVFAMEPVTLRWVNVELTVAIDLYSRCVTGLALRPVAATSPDVASVLYQTCTAQSWSRHDPESAIGPYVGLPDACLVHEIDTVPDTLVVDHGKIYLSKHTRAICQRFGINIQPAIPHKPTDKPTVERFFRTIRQQLLEQLPAYKGPDVASRGMNIEKQAFLYVTELEQIIREWVNIYHHTPHDGLCDPLLPEVDLSPAQMFARGIAQSGRLRIPANDDLAKEFLQVEWRTIQHYGVEIRGQRYNGPGLNLHRGRKSRYGGAHAGKWPFMVDPDDVRWAYFKDPDAGVWHRLEWEHAHGINAPFSQAAADYTRGVSVQENRFVEPAQALDDLLQAWSRQQVTDRREKNLALRLSTQRGIGTSDNTTEDARDASSVPGVIDFLTRRERTSRIGEGLTDDLDVFERYYAEHPDEGVLEVFDE